MNFKSLIILALIGYTYGQQCTTHPNSDIGLDNIAQHSGRQEGECCGICSSTAGCGGYSWNSYEGGTCWLKGGSGPIVSNPGVSAGVLTGGGGGDGLVTYQQFSNAITVHGYPTPSQVQHEVFINSAGPKGLITTKQEAAMALTHFLHESDGLRAKREYRCADTGCPGDYETQGCDVGGQDYYGRGYIQLTWCYNYKPASQYLFGDQRLVTDPDMVAREESVAWDTAFWFWSVNVHWAPGVQDGQFGASTNAINGGLECHGGAYEETARHRFDMYNKIRAAFGLSGNGDERGCYN